MHAAELAGNAAMLDSVGAAIAPACRRSPSAPGCCTCAERVDGAPMVGAVDGRRGDDAAARRSATARAVADHDQLLGAAGRRVTGHEFHRTTVTPVDRRTRLAGGRGRDGFSLDPAGTGAPDRARLLPAHPLGRAPALAARFAAAVHAYAAADPPALRAA